MGQCYTSSTGYCIPTLRGSIPCVICTGNVDARIDGVELDAADAGEHRF